MKPKRLPRLWCARQGLLPLEVKGDLMLDRAAAPVQLSGTRESRVEKIHAVELVPPPAQVARSSEPK